MKFMFFFLPTIPATLEERRSLRPISNHTERWQRMIGEVVEVAQMAEDLGFDAVCFPEHHLHSEGLEIGSLPVLYQHVIHNTKRIKVGPIGYVLPGWNPLRLALEIGWLDQLTKGRSIVGMAHPWDRFTRVFISFFEEQRHHSRTVTPSMRARRWCHRSERLGVHS